jgi:hypothetical protein
VSHADRPLYSRLVPILPVWDVLAEREFYETLGFARFVDPVEPYPETAFAALEYGAIRFGVAIQPEFDPASAASHLWWQIEVPDLDPVYKLAIAGELDVEQHPMVESWGRRTMKLRSPNGYVVTFEEMKS